MRILLVSHKFPPYALGGVEVYSHNLAQTLRHKHRVSVFFRQDGRNEHGFSEHDEEMDGVLTRRISSRPTGFGASVVGEFFDTFMGSQVEGSFARFVGLVQPDLVHIQHVMSLSARLMQIARSSGLPVVLTLHDYWFICGNSQLIWPDQQICRGKALGMNCVRCAAAARFPPPLVRWLRPGLAPLFLYRDRVVRQAARQADEIISPSRFLIDKYTAAGFPRERLHFLENGIPVDRIRRFARRPPTGRLRISFLGSIAWQKGVHVLAQAFNDLPAGIARLRIWGDLEVFPDYATRLQEMLTHPDAELMGRIANDRVGEVLADSDVMVVPSLWYENSPVVIQEARAAGVPVVASDLGALAEKVRHGIDGLLFPAGDAAALRDALLRLLMEGELLPHLRQSIPAPMDMQEHVEELERVYHRLVQKPT
jgi:glycosyltransferase involved in cell wall biosynthesis